MRSLLGVRWLLAAAFLIGYPAADLAAQGSDPARVTGQVVDQNGAPIAGVQIVIINQQTGAQFGSLSQDNGRYLVMGLRPGGPYRIEARMIGFSLEMVEDVSLDPGGTFEANFALGTEAIALDALEVFATRAVERRTPVAFTNVDQVKIERQLGSRDLPMVLNVTPSVYATQQGGGAGDARINVRGFDQRNTSVMINGVPVNDMENGWVYWSNWDGVGDATASIQLQRGLSAVNLATPSIGGTLNVITDPAAMDPGFNLKQEFGNGGFLKTTLVGATGLMDGKYSLMVAGVRKTGDGLITGTWTDAWAYYLAAGYHINTRNRLELFAVGAPQRHGQNLYKQNIGAYDASFARDLDGYDVAALEDYPQSSFGRKYNQNYNTVSSSYKGLQNVEGNTFSRFDPGFLNERENFYHKPQVNLNWYSYLASGLTLSTVGYFSGGIGGGTGTLGDESYDYGSQPTRLVDWDAQVAVNQGTEDRKGNAKPAGQSVAILRNSRNNQYTFGAISKLKWEYSEPLTLEVGLDWRTAEIEHYREVRDLLGGTYFECVDQYPISCGESDFWSGSQNRRTLGDKIDYNFTNTVDWLGAYAQGEYATPEYSLYGMGGVSTIKYGYTNHFRMTSAQTPLIAESDRINGWQMKGGAQFNVTDQVGLFANAGYVQRVPIFDGVIDDYAGALNPDPKNEKFMAIEGGVRYTSTDRGLALRFNGYWTQWKDRTRTRGYTLPDGSDALFSILGLDAIHKGVEAEVAWQPIDYARIDAGMSIGDWVYTNDATGTYRPDPGSPAEEWNYYVKDLKVGDAPQTQLYFVGNFFDFPVDGLFVSLVGRMYRRHYSAFSPFDRDDPTDRAQAWEAPGYSKFDLHAGYDLPRGLLPTDARLFLNVFNVTDKVYIQDALDNSPYNGFDDDHDADDAEVYFGLPRMFNFGIQVRY